MDLIILTVHRGKSWHIRVDLSDKVLKLKLIRINISFSNRVKVNSDKLKR